MSNDKDIVNKNEEKNVIIETIENEMKRSYLDYSMSVIVGRALPDVRDGLKPVHRRILYTMLEDGITSKTPYKKCARIVGSTLGKYHPHGDAAVYEALVRMAQDFSYRYTLIDGQGNFGSIDGDPPAAMRYTEARLSKISEEILQDIEKETVDFVPNFDNSLKEPVFLPGKFPNLLVNGASGIAVGMATNIPPHNLREVVDAIIAQIDNPEITTQELMKFIPGPDFPTGGEIYGKKGIISAYETGRGTIQIRAKVDIEKKAKSKRIIIKEIPYMVNKSQLVENIAKLVNEKKISGISDIRDESDRNGIRIVITLKHDAQENVVLAQLFKHTQLQVTFGIINLVLVNKVPKILSLKELINEYINHRTKIITKREEFELKKAEERLHILEGFKIVLAHTEEIVKGIKESKTAEDAKKFLMQNYGLTEQQSNAVLNMKLQQLTKLEDEKIEKEHHELTKEILKHKEILSDIKKIYEIIKNELIDLKNKYGDDRRTKIYDEILEYEEEDLVQNKDVIVMLTDDGYLKRIDENAFRLQKRRGTGVKGIEKDGILKEIILAKTLDYALLFTNTGKIYSTKIYKIPETGKTSKGKAGINIVNLKENEQIISISSCKDFDENKFLLIVTEKGIVKKTKISAYKTVAKTSKGIIAINLTENDKLIECKIVDDNDNIILATRDGKAIRFLVSEVRTVGRNSIGVKGIKLNEGDKVVGAIIAKENENNYILTVSEKGFGKRTLISEYKRQKRGGKGIINLKTSEKTGKVVVVKKVNDEDEILISSSKKIIKIKANEIRNVKRSGIGVRLMKFDEKNERICAVGVV